MAEVPFTEEDVQRYAEIGHRAWCACDTDDSAALGVEPTVVRAVLGALVEDGRLASCRLERGEHFGLRVREHGEWTPVRLVVDRAHAEELMAGHYHGQETQLMRCVDHRHLGPWEPVDTPPPAPAADEEKL